MLCSTAVWKWRGLPLLLLAALLVVCAAQKIGDPYKILGIHPKASLTEIRKAYKQLAKEWHPDKNEDSNAETRFVEIKQAYELLSDTDRRQAYDLYGITNEDDHMYKQRHDYSKYARFSNDPLEDFFGHFRTQDQDITLFHKLSVTTRHFENNILEKSVHTPALVLFYTDWCFECVRAAAAWRRLVAALQPLGVTAATVHAGHEAALARRVGLHGVPCLAFVIDRQVYLYKESLTNMPRILEFIRWKFPYRLVTPLTDATAAAFSADFEDNRVRALVFEQRPAVRLRYLLAAYAHRERVAFGFIDTSDPRTANTTALHRAPRGLDYVVLLKEGGRVAAAVAAAEVPTPALHELIQAHQLLTLPRLSSQSMLETLCPAEWRAARRRLCCVLLLAPGAAAGRARAALRALAAAAPARLQYAYVYTDAQSEFVKALANGSGTDTSQLDHRIVILWRRDPQRVQYEWLPRAWPTSPDPAVQGSSGAGSSGAAGSPGAEYQEQLNQTKQALDELIKRLLRPNEAMAYETNVKELADESRQGPVSLLLASLAAWAAHAGRGAALSALSVLATAAFIAVLGFITVRQVRLEDEKVAAWREARRRPAAERAPPSELRLHELRAENYNGLLRLLKPGCRCLVLLVDAQSRAQLLPRYHKIVWPYRKNRSLVFAHLSVPRHVEWFRRVLQLSLGGGALRLNARNCVGTVLALNAHRKYFCIYHAKHPESAAGKKRIRGVTRSLGGPAADPEAGAFIGFGTDPDSSGDEEPLPLLEEQLLDGLPNWLDRLFEGSTHRYHVNYWPDMTTK